MKIRNLQKHLITGVLVIAPVFLTLFVIIFIFRFADGILGRFINIHMQKTLGFYIPGIGVLLSLIIIISVGFLTNLFIGKKIYPQIEKWFSSLPIVKKIYPSFKQLISFILPQNEFSFKKVVLVEYPSKGIWSLGFLTNEHHENISRELNKNIVTVFIPSTPSPLTGYVIFVAKEDLKLIDMSIAEALKVIISGGVFKA